MNSLRKETLKNLSDKLRTSDFDYDLPNELIAHHPLAQRDRCRLMLLERESGKISHHIFADLPSLLKEGDILVLNDTCVIPARFISRRPTGGKIEGLFIREISKGKWEVMLKGAGRCKVGEVLCFQNRPDWTMELIERRGGGYWLVAITPADDAIRILQQVGLTPLPPYIRRAREGKNEPTVFADDIEQIDRQLYQTVYAARPGAIAAPTAGLHFTEELLSNLRDKGIETITVTLHVSAGTFSPVRTERIADHKLHAEWYELSAESADALLCARREGKRIIAVGTTSVRVLETVARKGAISPQSGWTDLFLYPPADFYLVDGLITNFHLPRSTLLMLVAAFCSPGSTKGVEMILQAYAEAIRLRYRFYSYGDAMLIL